MATVTLTTPIISIDELPDGLLLAEDDLIMVQRGDNSLKISREGIKVHDYNVISTPFTILTYSALSANMSVIDDYLATVDTIEAAYLDKNNNLSDITDAATARANLGIDTVNSVINKIYPIGALYTTTVNSTPQTILGLGTWQRFGEGQVIVGYSTTDSDFGTVVTAGSGTTQGGSKTIPYTGWGAQQNTNNELGQSGTTNTITQSGRLITGSGTKEDGEKLESLAHATTTQSNMPPYVTVYMWVRIA